MNEEERNGLMKQRRKAREKIKQLETNWNELKKFIDNQLCNIQFEYEERFLDRNEFNNKLGVLNRLKNKMQELEGNNE